MWHEDEIVGDVISTPQEYEDYLDELEDTEVKRITEEDLAKMWKEYESLDGDFTASEVSENTSKEYEELDVISYEDKNTDEA